MNRWTVLFFLVWRQIVWKCEQIWENQLSLLQNGLNFQLCMYFLPFEKVVHLKLREKHFKIAFLTCKIVSVTLHHKRKMSAIIRNCESELKRKATCLLNVQSRNGISCDSHVCISLQRFNIIEWSTQNVSMFQRMNMPKETNANCFKNSMDPIKWNCIGIEICSFYVSFGATVFCITGHSTVSFKFCLFPIQQQKKRRKKNNHPIQWNRFNLAEIFMIWTHCHHRTLVPFRKERNKKN